MRGGYRPIRTILPGFDPNISNPPPLLDYRATGISIRDKARTEVIHRQVNDLWQDSGLCFGNQMKDSRMFEQRPDDTAMDCRKLGVAHIAFPTPQHSNETLFVEIGL